MSRDQCSINDFQRLKWQAAFNLGDSGFRIQSWMFHRSEKVAYQPKGFFLKWVLNLYGHFYKFILQYSHPLVENSFIWKPRCPDRPTANVTLTMENIFPLICFPHLKVRMNKTGYARQCHILLICTQCTHFLLDGKKLQKTPHHGSPENLATSTCCNLHVTGYELWNNLPTCTQWPLGRSQQGHKGHICMWQAFLHTGEGARFKRGW